MKRSLFTVVCLAAAIAAVLISAAPVHCQEVYTFMAGTGDWNMDANWTGATSGNFVPSNQFSELAQINNAASLAQVTDTPPDFAQLTVGPGAVEVLDGGSLLVQPGSAAGNGFTTINANGRLSVASGGSLSATRLNVNGTLEVAGPNAMITAPDAGFIPSISLGATSTLVPQIGSTAFNPIATDGVVLINGGDLHVEFGYTPNPADTWDIIDAGFIDGNFGSVSISGANLEPWETYAVHTNAGGANGTVATLQFENRLVLSVNRATGVGTVQNMAAEPIVLDGYTIGSALGSIGTGNYNSFDEQNLDGGSWSEIGTQTANGIGELRESGATSLASSSSRAIGGIYDPTISDLSQLGVDFEDLTFSYTNSNGDSFEGMVMYEGDKKFNNLVLNVDPITGEAVLVNESPLTYSFDGYTISSASGSLFTGSWDSLDDQDAAGGDWFEIGSDSSLIGELKQLGETTLNQGTSFNLGNIFNTTAGSQDLQLQFIFGGDILTPRMGQVSYESLVIGPGVAGDYNEDGVVNAADYTIWRNAMGQSITLPNENSAATTPGVVDQEDYDFWVSRFGATSGSGSGAGSAVPEPTSIMLLMSALVLSILNLNSRRAAR